MVSNCEFVTFGILGQVWLLIVSIPDLCTLTYCDLPIFLISGMFFQWIYCSATMITGVVVQLIRNCPTFHPIVMLGGMFFATGTFLEKNYIS